MKVLNRLVDAGGSVLLIEHNLDVIRNSDYLIDLGPEAGRKGGKIVATGLSGRNSQEQKIHNRPLSVALCNLFRV